MGERAPMLDRLLLLALVTACAVCERSGGDGGSTRGIDGSSTEGGPQSTITSTSSSTRAPDVPDGDTASFVPPTDVGPSSECGVFEQDCPPGYKCAPWAIEPGAGFPFTHCVPLPRRPVEENEPCTVDAGPRGASVDDCAPGLVCWGQLDTNDGIGRCLPLCTAEAGIFDCHMRGDVCLSSASLRYLVCVPPCDPLAPACDVIGDLCIPFKDDWVCFPRSSDDLGGPGDPCDGLADCDAGLICLGPLAFSECTSDAGCCSPVCDITDPDAAATCGALDPGQGCEPWFPEGMAPPGYERVGVCAVPG